MATLQDIIGKLPRVLSSRYAEPFWINAANKVLLDIEQKQELPRVKEEFGLVLQDRITNYPIPSYVKKVLGVYKAGSPNINQREELNWSIRGGYLQIDSGFVFNETPLVENAIVKTGSTQIQILSDELVDELEHRLVVYIDGENAGYTSVIQRYDYQTGVPPENIAHLKRPLPFAPLVGELINIHEAYLVVEYVKGFNRVVDLVCDIVDDEDVQRVIEEGLRYYGELQVDEESEYAIRWSQQYRRALKSYVNFRTRGLFKPKSKFSVDLKSQRVEPSRFYGNNSGVFGDQDAQT